MWLNVMGCFHAATLLKSLSRSAECVKWVSPTVVLLWGGWCWVCVWLPTTIYEFCWFWSMWLLCEGRIGLHICVCVSDHQTISPVLNQRKARLAWSYSRLFWRYPTNGDTLVWMTRKETNIQHHFVNKADGFPSHKWHVSHFSLRWVCDWCLQ